MRSRQRVSRFPYRGFVIVTRPFEQQSRTSNVHHRWYIFIEERDEDWTGMSREEGIRQATAWIDQLLRGTPV